MRYLIVILSLLAVNAGATKYYLANDTATTYDGVTYEYVSTASNANAGTAPSAPWKTFEHADSTMSNGDTLYIMGGIWFRSSGLTSSNGYYRPVFYISTPMAIKPYLITDSVTLLPMIKGILNDSVLCPGIWIEANSVTVDSMRIDTCSRAGVCWFAQDSITITNCHITNIWERYEDGLENNRGGIYFNAATSSGEAETPSEHCIIRGNTISHIRNGSGALVYFNNANAIHGRGLKNSIIDSNDVSYCSYGIRLKTDNDSNIVEYNACHNLLYDMIGIHSSADDNIVRFNYGWDCGGIDLQHETGDGGAQFCQNNWIYNNTIYNDGGEEAGGGLVWSTTSGAAYNQIRDNHWFNNVVVGFSGINSSSYLQHRFSDSADALLDYNCYWNGTVGEVVSYYGVGRTLAAWLTYTNGTLGWDVDSNSVNVDPQFLNTADSSNAGFLHLDTTNSPAALLTDAAGSAVPLPALAGGGSAPTYMGAYDPYPDAGIPADTAIVIKGQIHISGQIRKVGK